MSAAPQLNRAREAQIGSPAAPVVRPVPRPARARRISLPSALALTATWAAGMFLAFSLVQTNATIRETNVAINRAQHEIAQMEQHNLALEGQIANAASVDEVERWALAHGMQQPTGVVETLPGNAAAIADRTPAAPVPAKPEVTAAEQPFWQGLMAGFADRLSAMAAGLQ